MRSRTYRLFAAAALVGSMAPLSAQISARPAAAPATVAAKAPAAAPAAAPASVTAARPGKIPLSALYAVERGCDEKLRALGEPNTVELMGATRGIYLENYGAVFTAEIGLVTPPALYPFHPTITPEEKALLHKKKIERLPRLRDTIREMVRAAAASLPGVPEDQQIVVAVRLDYRAWEDTSGLPGVIILKADRKSALAGTFTVEEQ